MIILQGKDIEVLIKLGYEIQEIAQMGDGQVEQILETVHNFGENKVEAVSDVNMWGYSRAG